MIFNKVYDNVNNLKINNVNFDIALNFMFVCNKIYYKCDNPPILNTFFITMVNTKMRTREWPPTLDETKDFIKEV